MSKKLSKSEELFLKSKEKRDARRKIQQESNQPSINENLKRNDSNRIAIKISYNQLYEAPSEWNKYSRHSEEKRAEMISSITEKGLIEPITVWKVPKQEVKEHYSNHTPQYHFEGNDYMILVGHNRTEDCKHIYDSTGNTEFETIHAFVIDDLNEMTARGYIVDSNYLARDLSLEEVVESVNFKYEIYLDPKNNKKVKGVKTSELVAKELDKSSRTIQNFRTLHKLIPELKALAFSKKVGVTNIIHVSYMDVEMQEWFYITYGDKITDAKLKKIKKGMTKEDIDNIFILKEKDKKDVCVNVKFAVPIQLENMFKEMAQKWLQEHTS